MLKSVPPVVRAGCYLRISSDPNDKRQGVDRQREDTSVECERLGWAVAGFYEDNDVSATSGGARPAWDRLIADIKAGKIDAVVVWNQDRGWRKMSELETLRPVFAAHGVRLSTTNIGMIDFSNPDDIFRTQISTAQSELEVAKLKIRVRRAARQKAQQGRPHWRHAFGYRQGPQGIELNPMTAPFVAQVYADVLAGCSISDCARYLNDSGALAEKWAHPRDENGDRIEGSVMECIRSPWSPSTLSMFLRQGRNAGLREHNRKIVLDDTGQPVKGQWPPLVDESTWRAVQDVLNKPGRAPGPKSVREHLLTGLLWCGKPGCDDTLGGAWVMQAVGDGKGAPRGHRITYVCRKCRGCSIRAEHVEPLLEKIIAARLAREDAVDLLKSARHDSAEAEAIRRERSTLLELIDAANREYDDGIIDGLRLQGRTRTAREKLAALDLRERDQERLRILDGLPLGRPEVAEAIKGLSRDRYRAVVSLLVDVTVAPVGKGGRVFKAERVLDGVAWKI